jgi:hypothetical protein
MDLLSEQNIFFGNKPMGVCAKIFFFRHLKFIFVGINFCKNFKAQNLISNRLVIILRCPLFYSTKQKSHFLGHFFTNTGITRI